MSGHAIWDTCTVRESDKNLDVINFWKQVPPTLSSIATRKTQPVVDGDVPVILVGV